MGFSSIQGRLSFQSHKVVRLPSLELCKPRSEKHFVKELEGIQASTDNALGPFRNCKWMVLWWGLYSFLTLSVAHACLF